MAEELPEKVKRQIDKAGLPTGGTVPFYPRLEVNKKGRQIIKKDTVTHGPKKGKKDMLTSREEFGSRIERTPVTPITGMCKRTAAENTSELIRRETCFPSSTNRC